MSMQNAVQFEEDAPRDVAGLAASEADNLLLNIDGYEGPIEVLLDLARNQKVDITKISILQLARQYLVFIERAQKLNLELAVSVDAIAERPNNLSLMPSGTKLSSVVHALNAPMRGNLPSIRFMRVTASSIDIKL